MSLIEQLGGYENSKCYLESCGDMDSIGGFTPLQIQEALLEHRRKRNIFEVGDLVVEIAESPETSILKVIHMGDYLMVCENDRLKVSYGVLNEKPSFYVRHATEEEIKVGCRL